MKKLITKVMKWHEDRNLIEGSTDKDQVWRNGLNNPSLVPYSKFDK